MSSTYTRSSTATLHPGTRTTTAIAALLLLTTSSLLTGCERMQDRMIERRIERGLAGDRENLMKDGSLHVILCGTGSPLPDADRAAACTAVIAGNNFYLVDVGPGSQEVVQLMRLPRARLSGVLLTHFHSDHIGGLGEVTMQSWVAGRDKPLPVYGGPGVEQVVDGFNTAYKHDRAYRVAHHGDHAMPPEGGRTVSRPFEVAEQRVTIIEDDELLVTAFKVEHDPVEPAVGYRFDYGGRSVVISGDTGRSDALVEASRGADLLVHEALAGHLISRMSRLAGERGLDRLAGLSADILDYHATPAEALDAARRAGVPTLVLTHLVPGPPNRLAERVFMRGTDDTDVELILGRDGMHFVLPPGGGLQRENLE